MKKIRTTLSPSFRKTLLASVLVSLLTPLYSWAAQTVSITDGSSVEISGEYGTDSDNLSPVVVQGSTSVVTGDADVTIHTTGRAANGANVTNGGTLNLNGAVIKTDGVVARGINNSKSTVNLQGGAVTTAGSSAYGVSSTGLGSRTDINGTVISTSGISAYGISGSGGTQLTVNNTTLNASGSGSYGIFLSSIGSTLSGSNNTINNTSTASGIGVYIDNGGVHATLDNTTINMDNASTGVSVGQDSSIVMDGLNVTGNILQVFNINGKATVSNADIELASGGVLRAIGNSLSKAITVLNDVNAVSNSGNTVMIDVNSNSDVTLNGGSYHTKGSDATGVWITDSASSFKAKDTVIITEGDNATAIDNRGTAVVENTTTITKGNNADGIYSERIFDASNMTISTAGVASIGAAAARGGNLNLTGATIDTTGDLGIVLGTFAGSSINAKNVTATSTGVGAYALWTDIRGSITLKDSQITTTGMDASGIYATASDVVYSKVTLDNTQIISENGAGVHTEGANINVNVNNGSQLTGGNGLLINASTHLGTMSTISNVNLNADNHSTLVGDILAEENNNASLTLTNNSVWTGAAHNAKSVEVDSSSIWHLTGDADVESMHILGQMNFIPTGSNPNARAVGDSFSTLTINSNLTGNGSFVFNAKLGDDSSPADRLYVTGSATGDHYIWVVNQGGLGALTTGTGINLITVEGDTDSGQFTMSNAVVAGAYQYFLYQIDDHRWNLQSNLTPVDPTDPGEIITTDPEIPGEVIPTDPAPFVPEPVVPPTPETAYRGEVPGYIAAPWLNAFYGFTTLGSLHERRGSAEGAANGFNQDSWGRISGQHNKFDAGRFSYDSDIWFVQLGHDFYQAESSAGTQATAGVLITLGKQETDTQDKARAVRPELSVNTGKIKTDAYGLGGYYTLMTQQGGYIDVVGQGTLYRNSYQSQYDANQNGYGVAMSAEVGQVYPIAGSWKVEPQGQLKYQYLNLNSFNDEISGVNGTSYSVGQVRAGVRVFSEGTKPQAIKPYLSTDVVSQLGKNPKVTVDTVSLRPEFSKTYWQGGAGVTAKVNSNVDIYADVKYQRAFDGNMDGYAGNLGVKVSF
ncbi:autotransporter outer membrane beta-barrel domain-containing protein [Yersinia pekkanenii]|uniref:Autotransporter protein n=1 Tax=Yersinia pekkanenii TaxID=1288385 RepID=A0A0T9QPB5_9GAMM|nr:autotransporter outer membrane beta-barrel domain-containing protein [Yersinia pekkanenii]CNI21695.1 putative autotransporter protein [Yersinia pekkanenii]CRY66294.1 putative autotransporter protein [Yersinia pekkanenii]